jgi:amidase
VSELTFLSAAAMAEQIRKKSISVSEVVEAHLQQIQNLNPKLNAFVQVDSGRARQTAREAEQALEEGNSLGPLHGVPVSIKSSISAVGL